MKRIVLLLLTLLLPAMAGAEGSCYSGERSFSNRQALAEVGGQVYGLSGYEGWVAAFTPAVERWSPEGERTKVGVNTLFTSEINGISGLGDTLLVWRQEKSLLAALDHSAPYEPRYERWDPETSRCKALDGIVFVVQSRLWRSGDDQVQLLSADGSEVLGAWPGTAAAWWDSFILLEDGEKRMLLDAATGDCWDVTAMQPGLRWSSEAALEDGVLYLLEDTALAAIDLRDGTRRALLTFPAETYGAFVLDAERIVLLGRTWRGDPIRSVVYDRETLQATLTFTHMTNPVDALLSGDRLYLRSPYSGTVSAGEDHPGWSRDASATIIDLTTGNTVYWELND